MGIAYAHFNPMISATPLQSLDARVSANVASLSASYPLVRTRRASVIWSDGVDVKSFDDRGWDLVSARRAGKPRAAALGINGDA